MTHVPQSKINRWFRWDDKTSGLPELGLAVDARAKFPTEFGWELNHVQFVLECLRLIQLMRGGVEPTEPLLIQVMTQEVDQRIAYLERYGITTAWCIDIRTDTLWLFFRFKDDVVREGKALMPAHQSA